LLGTGLATADEIDQHLADLDSPGLDIAAFPVVSAWSRKPPEQSSTTRKDGA
jgi:hypothetical protein